MVRPTVHDFAIEEARALGVLSRLLDISPDNKTIDHQGQTWSRDDIRERLISIRSIDKQGIQAAFNGDLEPLE